MRARVAGCFRSNEALGRDAGRARNDLYESRASWLSWSVWRPGGADGYAGEERAGPDRHRFSRTLYCGSSRSRWP